MEPMTSSLITFTAQRGVNDRRVTVLCTNHEYDIKRVGNVIDTLLENHLVKTFIEGKRFLSMGLVMRKDGRDWKVVGDPYAEVRQGTWRVWRRGYMRVSGNGILADIRLLGKV